MHEKPRVTVVIPNYNYGIWIEDCLDSVANDLYDNKCMVVVDDASTDNSSQKVFDLIKSPSEFTKNGISGINGFYKNTNIEIKLIAINKTVGPSASRNIGMKSCFEETDFFSFIDSDDMHISGKIKRTLTKMLENNGFVAVVYCDYENLYVQTGKVHQQYKEPFCLDKILNDCIIPCHSLVSKKAIEEVGFFDESMRVAEDYDLWIRISKKFLCYHIPEKLAIVRRGKHNSDYSVPKNIWQKNWSRIREKISNEP